MQCLQHVRRVLACLAVLMLVQSHWPMQQSLPLNQWQDSLAAQGGSRRLFALDTLAPALPQGAVCAVGNADRPDWVR